jgi:hypothetical protein
VTGRVQKVKPLKTDIHLNYTQKFSFCLTNIQFLSIL